MNDFTRLTIDAALGTVAGNYSVEDVNETIRKQFAAVLGVDENSSAKEIRKAVRRNKAAVYDLIEETIEELLVSGWGENPFFREFVEERNLANGDQNVFYVPDQSILTVSKFSGNHHDIIRQKLGMGSDFTVTTSWYGVKIYEEFIRFQTGRIDWAAFINKIYEAFDKKINDMIYDAFMDVDKSLPASYAETGTLSAQTMIDLCEKVATGTGHEVVIVGTRAALSALMNLTPAGWISGDMKNERNTTGLVQYFEGIRTMVVPQVFEEGTRNFKLPTKKLYVFPVTDNKFIKLVNEGESMFFETTDAATNMDMTIEAEYMAKLGVATIVGLDFGTYTFD